VFGSLCPISARTGWRALVGKTKIAAQNSLTRTVAIVYAIAIHIHFHPVIADQPDEILSGERFIETELPLENFNLLRADLAAAALACQWSTRSEIYQCKEKDAEKE
jgi:hypothetical protein